MTKIFSNNIAVFTFLCLLFIFDSCQSEKEREVCKYLAHVDSIMDDNPHVADSLLKIVKPDVESFSADLQMKYSMLYADAKNKLFDTMPEAKSFFKVVEYYDEHGTENEKMKAHYLLGCIYRDLRDAPEALKCYYDAQSMITDTANCDNDLLMCVWGQMAELFFLQNMIKDEINARLKFIEYANKNNDTTQILLGHEHLINAYMQAEDTAKVLNQTFKTIELFKKYGKDSIAAEIYPCIIAIYLHRKNYSKAHELICQVETNTDMFDENHEVTYGREAYYYYLGLYSLGVHQLDSAEYYFRKLESFKKYRMSYDGLMRLYHEKQDVDSVLKYADLYSVNVNENAKKNQAEVVNQMKSLYDYSHYKNDALALQVSNQRNIILFCFIGGAMIIVIIAGYLYFRSRAKQKKMEVEFICEKYKIAEKKREKINLEYNNLRSEYKKKEETLVIKTKELSESLRKHMYVNEENKVLNTELGQVVKFKPRFLSNDEWIMLDQLIKDNMTCFYELISNIQLSVQERQVCMLSRLGCTSQNIMIILNLSYSAGVSNVKRSVNKKMFNDNNARTLCDNMLAKEKEIIKKQELLIDN